MNMKLPKFSKLLFFALLLLLATSIIAQEVEDESEFDYRKGSKKGPEHWGELKKEWRMCKIGKMQSPIDLLTYGRVQVVPKSKEIIRFYKPEKAILKNRGHDIEIKLKGEGSKIHLNGTDYILRQLHWHSPSEHTINGKRFASELHLVHQSSDSKIAVIGVVYTIGKPDPFLNKLMKKIKSISDTSEEIDIGVIDPVNIKMRGSKYYRYLGSLTTPPCTQGVIWTINKQIATISQEQVQLLREAVHDHAEHNARPVQSLNGRKVHLLTSKRSYHGGKSLLPKTPFQV